MRKTVRPLEFKLSNETGRLAENITEKWLLGLRESNPAILDMFHDRDMMPFRDLLPWSGEFAGKYITSAYYIYNLTKDKVLYDYITGFIDEMLTYQGDDGYLGCFSNECHLTGAYSQNPSVPGSSWDTWAHYHIMYGLHLWHNITKNQKYFNAITKIADLFMKTFYNGKMRMVSIGWAEMNLAPLHIFAILYNETKEQKYLDFALEIEKDLSDEAAGNYITHSLNGLEYFQCPKPRWESMHIIMGIAQMYNCTGDDKYLKVAKQIFYSILKTDVHNTGAFSTDEAAIGHPFKNSAIETCCVIAYNVLACEILALTGDLKIVDFLELSLYNAVMGSFSPTGRWSTYNTPMDGVKCANFHSINFQCRAGSPELNCCSVNAPRGVGMLSEWALQEENEVTYINYFECFSAKIDSGLEIKVTSDYPVDNCIQIILKSDKSRKIAIRIPEWSKNTKVGLNGEEQKTVAGTYLFLEKTWGDDLIKIEFDFSTHYIDGDLDYKGMKSIFKGPILYGYDLYFNHAFDFNNIPAIPSADLDKAIPHKMSDGRILLKLDCGITLCDFYHMGLSGSQYKTWIKVK